MTLAAAALEGVVNLFGPPADGEGFDGLDARADGAVLDAIAAAITGPGRAAGGRARRADIPVGAVHLAQFAIHDLDFRGRAGEAQHGRCDLGLIYGDGPRHDPAYYRMPEQAGDTRYLLKMGYARPARGTPALSAARDLPRAACPHLDPKGREAMAEVLVPNALSDSSLPLSQMQTLWMLLHNAVAGRLTPLGPARAFAVARELTRGIYRATLRRDVLGTWLAPALRARYASEAPDRLDPARPDGVPREFMAGTGRLGHVMVREVYALNASRTAAGLRDVIRHGGAIRPHDMPLAEDWLIDFSRFFAIGASVPQRARAIGPSAPRVFAAGRGFGHGVGYPAEGLVLRDLQASARPDVRSVRSLIAAVRARDAAVLDGALAADEDAWARRLGDWLAAAGVGGAAAARLALDPPLLLFLMIEAEVEADGRHLGTLGSVIMGETLAAALAAPATVAGATAADVAAAGERVFGAPVPASMAEMIEFLQRHYRFAAAARLHDTTVEVPQAPPRRTPHARRPSRTEGASAMNAIDLALRPVPRTRVTDHYEMGKLVVQWTLEPTSRPRSILELRAQLAGIAEVPEEVRSFSFCENAVGHLAIRLPAPEMVRESLDRLTDPAGPLEYPIPQFYADHFHPGLAPVLTPLDMLYARIGDYTIAQCR